MNKQLRILVWLFALVSLIGLFWNSIPFLKSGVHAIFDPTLGNLLTWNPLYGMLILVAILNVGLVLVQKHTTDQDAMKSIKKEQKELNAEMKNYKDNPEKMMELNKKNFGFMKETFSHSLRPMMFTLIPFVLLFRWFQDYFLDSTIRLLGMSWFWFYLVSSIVFSSIFRKTFDVA
jgi:uncharacterized membrane protein (DUF106 family)